MLHRSKRRKKRLGVVWSTAYGLIAVLGGYALYLGCSGIVLGHVESFSRFNRGTIDFASQPAAFGLAIALWLSGGFFMIGLAVHGWRTAST